MRTLPAPGWRSTGATTSPAAMLRHHLHKSTQYMAQWIEAKNRVL
jgi:hypothetical protein